MKKSIKNLINNEIKNSIHIKGGDEGDSMETYHILLGLGSAEGLRVLVGGE